MPVFECAWLASSCANTVWVICASLDVGSVFLLMSGVSNYLVCEIKTLVQPHLLNMRFHLNGIRLSLEGNRYQFAQWDSL